MLLEISQFGEGAFYSIICIVIVFLVLAGICLLVSLMKYLKLEDAKKEVKPEVAPSVQTKKLTIEDITDEDMMAAALVATIDYRNEVNTDVRLVSIKKIN